MNSPPPILTPAEAAELLRLYDRQGEPSPRAVLELARKRVIPSVKIAGERRFLLSSVLEALAEREDPALSDDEIKARIEALAPARRGRN